MLGEKYAGGISVHSVHSVHRRAPAGWSLKAPRRGELIAAIELSGGVDDLAAAADHPQSALGVGVANGAVVAGFEAVRDDAAVPAVVQPLLEIAGGVGRDPAQCYGFGQNGAVALDKVAIR